MNVFVAALVLVLSPAVRACKSGRWPRGPTLFAVSSLSRKELQ